MKDILFRGKRKDNGEWIEGYYAKVTYYLGETMHIILPINVKMFPHCEFSNFYEVIPETVGRLLDRAGYNCDTPEQKIFEGDIIEIRRSKGKDDGYLRMGIAVNESCITEDGNGRMFPQDTVQVKVVGNVHDNPELIGKKYADLYKYYYSYEGLEVIES